MDRFETVAYDTFTGHGHDTLGSLRRLLREVADWPDDTDVEVARITLRRPLHLTTEGEVQR